MAILWDTEQYDRAGEPTRGPGMRAQLVRLTAAIALCSTVLTLLSGCAPGAEAIVTTPVKQAAKQLVKAAEKRTVAEATGDAAEKAGKAAAEKMARDRATRETFTVKEEAARLKAGQPLGRGHTGNFTPHDLSEKLAMDEVMSNPAAGEIAIADGKLKDPRWPVKEGWVKKRRTIEGTGITIHYLFNPSTGAIDDLKFK